MRSGLFAGTGYGVYRIGDDSAAKGAGAFIPAK
jgi:hypothetical protein